MKKHLALVVGMVAIAMVVALTSLYLQVLVIEDRVIPGAGILLPDWLDDFKRLSNIVIGVAAVSAVTWYVLGAWIFQISDVPDAGRRSIWLALLLLPALTLVIAAMVTPHALAGSWIAYAFYGLNGIGTFYLATALFSPPSFSYSAPGARALRYW